jgi:hypothetical protein
MALLDVHLDIRGVCGKTGRSIQSWLLPTDSEQLTAENAANQVDCYNGVTETLSHHVKRGRQMKHRYLDRMTECLKQSADYAEGRRIFTEGN